MFTVSQSEPELLAVVPSSGVQGLTASPVTITGAFTNFVGGTTSVANFGTGITVNSVNVIESRLRCKPTLPCNRRRRWVIATSP